MKFVVDVKYTKSKSLRTRTVAYTISRTHLKTSNPSGCKLIVQSLDSRKMTVTEKKEYKPDSTPSRAMQE